MVPGLAKVLCSFLNVNHVSQKEVKFLLQRLHLDPAKPIHFDIFYGRIRDGVPVADYPNWLDPQNRRKENFQEHTEAIKAIKKLNKEQIIKVLPTIDGDAITRSDVKRCLEYLGFYLNDVNFQKFWENITLKMSKGNVIPAKRMRVFLGFDAEDAPASQVDEDATPRPAGSEISTAIDSTTTSANLEDKRKTRKLTIEIEKWLKDRFRKAFEALKKTFEEADKAIHHEQITGTLPRNSFRACMGKYGLQLSNDEQLEMFLARCGLWFGGFRYGFSSGYYVRFCKIYVTTRKLFFQSKLARERVDYRQFLHTFQDRSEYGNARKILADPRHRFNQALTESIGPRTTVSAVEARLLALFQGEYLSLLGTLHRLDRSHSGRLEAEEFRAAIESNLGVEFTGFLVFDCPGSGSSISQKLSIKNLKTTLFHRRGI